MTRRTVLVPIIHAAKQFRPCPPDYSTSFALIRFELDSRRSCPEQVILHICLFAFVLLKFLRCLMLCGSLWPVAVSLSNLLLWPEALRFLFSAAIRLAEPVGATFRHFRLTALNSILSSVVKRDEV